MSAGATNRSAPSGVAQGLVTVSDAIIQGLVDWGVEVVFGLPGDGSNGFHGRTAERPRQIRYIHMRHEEAAAMAACGYAKSTGRLAACFSTAGPGAVHLLNGLYDAKIDRAPVITRITCTRT